MNLIKVLQAVAMFLAVTLIHTIKIALGINGEIGDSGPIFPDDHGYPIPDGLGHALLGTALITFLVGLVFFHLDGEALTAIVLMSFFGVMFWSGFVTPPIRILFLHIHFPRGTWFYLPRRGETPALCE